MSKHFARSEFACRHCAVALVRPQLEAKLELLRAMHHRPIRIVDGYRCPVHNSRVGGAEDSQHMYGAAVDVPRGTCTLREAIAAGFTGIGTEGGEPVHLDVRDGPLTQWRYDR